MRATTRVLVVLVAFGLTGLATATPVSATHSCMEDMPCPPHIEDPGHPKDLIRKATDLVRCLILAQPPTACL